MHIFLIDRELQIEASSAVSPMPWGANVYGKIAVTVLYSNLNPESSENLDCG
jgi:hypothetical protein